MSFDFPDDLENVEIDELLAKAQEESLRFYNEVELPRIQGAKNETQSKDETNVSSQDVEKRGSLLYDGADARGFHLDAGKTYIYPTNYPVRQYQATIVKTALFKNTMVSLPTGLGKTFIAAVVMYNFYRWYPKGKVVFMAPTRPLVAQQTKACHDIMNIPVDDTAELTGMQNAELREKLWKEKRVFYLTPQVMVNDLKSKSCPASLIRCIVIDEAHRAVKDYAYCQVLKILTEESGLYRVLGLSATPGNDVTAVQQVVRNLGISALEMRSEDSLDVAPYTHSRSIVTVVVELSGNILRVKDDLLQVYEKYAKRLKDFKALSNNIANVTKFQVLKACEKFRANPPRGVPPSVIGNLISDFTVCMSLAHSLELLQTYGLRAFYSYLSDDNSEKMKAAATRLRNDDDLKEMLRRLQSCLFPKVNNDNSFTWSHPKQKNLVTALTEHFQKYQTNGGSTKAIIFCQYRIVVSEIVELLSKFKPLIKAAEFIGQSGGKEKGMPQAKQLQIMKDFRNGIINCLVATCVAEEGLDIGEVDLIILMESHKSPVRLVQRIGRTGRKRKGNCLVLLTKGKEEQKFHEAMSTRKSYVENIMKSPIVKASLCQHSPRMIPIEFSPVQQLVHINVSNLVSPTKPQVKKQADIRKCFVSSDSPILSNEALLKVVKQLGTSNLTLDVLPTHEEIWHRRFDNKISVDELLSKNSCKLSEWNEWNHEEHETYHIGHTSDSKFLCHILKLSSQEIVMPDWMTLAKTGEKTIQFDKNEEKINILETEKFTSPNRRKKMKKEIIKHKLGMDIRKCLADKNSLMQQPRQFIEIISDDEISENANHITVLKSYETNDVSFFPQELKQAPLSDFFKKENSLFSDLDKLIASTIPSKKWTCSRNLPKLEELFENMTIDIIENLRFDSISLNNDVLKVSQDIYKCDEFVVVDELFDSGSDNDKNDEHYLNTKITEFHDDINFEKNQKAVTISLKNNYISTQGVHLPTLQGEKKIISDHFSNSCEISKKNKYVKIEDENSLFLNRSSSPLETINIFSSTPNPSFKNFKKNPSRIKSFSQPVSMNIILEEHQSPLSEVSDMWNISDLFDEEEMKNNFQSEAKNNVHSEISVKDKLFDSRNNCDTTMLGITQMVSLIEREKDNKKSVEIINSECRENDISKQLRFGSQKESELCCFLDCDTDIFLGINDESVIIPKPPKDLVKNIKFSTKECSNDNNIFPSQSSSTFKNELFASKKKNISPKKTTENLDDLPCIKPNSQFSQPNFKKFTSKKALFFKAKNSLSNFSEKPPSENSEGLSQKPFRLGGNSSYSDSNKTQSDLIKLIASNTTGNQIKNNHSSEIREAISNMKMIDKEKNQNCGVVETKSNDTGVHICKPEKEKVQKPISNSINKPIWNVFDSDDSELFMPLSQNKRKVFTKTKETLRNKRTFRKKHKESNDFIEKEAEVSGSIISSDDTDGSSLDDVDNSFINDNTEYVLNATQAIYLKSVKSPLNHGKFKIPVHKAYHENVYSQQVEGDSEYIKDSFCIDSEDEEEESGHSLSFLEIAERKLESNKNNHPKQNRRRILISSQEQSSEEPLVTMSQSSPMPKPKNRKRRILSSDSEFEEASLEQRGTKKRRNANDLSQIHNLTQNNPKRNEIKPSSLSKPCASEKKNIEKENGFVDLTIDSDDNDSLFEKKFQKDLKEAIVRSQSEFVNSSLSKTSTPKSEKKNFNLKKLDKSVHELNKRFSERLHKIKNKFSLTNDFDLN